MGGFFYKTREGYCTRRTALLCCALVLSVFLLPLWGQVLVFDPNQAAESEQPTSRIINPVLSPAPPASLVSPTSTALSGLQDPTETLPQSQGRVVFAIPSQNNSQLIPQSQASPIRLVQAATPFQGNTTPAYAPGQGAVTPATTPGFPASGNPAWDPYSTPGSGPLFGSNSFGNLPDGSKVMRRFIEKVSLDYTFIPRGSEDKGFGVNELAYQTEFTFPCRFLPNSEPIYLVPGLTLDWWDGPVGDPYGYNMSPSGFAGYLEVGTAPRYTENFAFEVWLRGGAYSDFNRLDSKAFRLEGRGAVLIGLTKDMEGVLGIVYLNRSRIKILPQIGVIWKPNSTVTWRLVFPDPKLSKRIATVGTMQWDVYLRGEYGGGCWAITDNYLNETILTDYNDVRIGIGAEFSNNAWINGFFELGCTFAREIYSNGNAWFEPDSTVYLKGGFHF